MDLNKFLDIQEIDEKNEKNFKEIYGKKNGIWIVVGKNKKSKEKQVLNVAITVDIYKEIKKDLDCSKTKKDWKKEKPYINQFGETKFMYPNNGYARVYVYSYIFNKYEDIKFYCIAKGDKEEFNSSRKKEIEKLVAYHTKAEYWRNGRPFQKEQSKDKKEAIDNKIKEYLDKNSEIIGSVFFKDLEKILSSKN